MLGGYRVMESTIAVKRVERRVCGGYLNRWLIREVAYEPSLWVSEFSRTIWVHPALMPQIRRAGGLA